MPPRLFGLGDPAAYLDATGRAARVAVDTAYDRAGVHPDTPSTHLADAVDAVDFSHPTGSLDDALAEVAELYAHQTTAYHHPRYAAHLNCPVLLSSTAADTVLGALNTAVESWDQARSAALMEQRLLAEVGRWCGFPAGDGVFTSGGSASNLQAMTLARGRAVQRLTGHAGLADLPAEALGSLRVFVSAATHYSIAKAAGLLGLGRHAVVVVPTDAAGRLDPGALAAAVEREVAAGAVPMAVVATLGTTDRGAVDPLPAIADVAERHGMWIHADAAVGGILAATAATRHELPGLHRADSVTMDFHKTFYVGLACSALVVRDAESLRHVTVHADYLNPEDSVHPNLADRSLQTSRRFDSLKLWLTLREHGAEAVASLFAGARERTRQACGILRARPTFAVLEDPTLVTVLFRVRAEGLSEEECTAVQAATHRELVAGGRALIATTVVDGVPHLKFTILNPAVTSGELEALVDVVEEAALRHVDAVRAGRLRRNLVARTRPYVPSASVSCALASSAGPRPSAARVDEHGEQVCA
ncbi:pyridoxal phosphate-dependent decarboxylase family protein [Micrococcus luteus]|uniref:pyridoxal phosphate-dependent decarboxylase family protein n=1 Tax=Micrococcus luteus TaxID=1270 RepID=UPI0028920649|nr:pyridoxal-dependent decarboxylase [Micrococcus luteus]MDT1990859.1 pyridoxal-dependent decarboxylase [Micrococcus luteus]